MCVAERDEAISGNLFAESKIQAVNMALETLEESRRLDQ